MKVLFICMANAGRSQIAQAFFEKLAPKHTTFSAGAKVEIEGRQIPDIVVETMAQVGYDLSGRKRKQVTQQMEKEADHIVVLLPDHERGLLPEFILSSKKVEYWSIEDMNSSDINVFISARNEIKKHVEELTKRID